MEYDHDLTWAHITPGMKHKCEPIKAFLRENGLAFEDGWDVTITASTPEEIIAAGSLAANVLKHIACKREYEGLGITSKLISLLISHAASLDRHHLFVFTKPQNTEKFEDLGFYPIAFSGGDAVLLDNQPHGVSTYLSGLKKANLAGINGCIVMNGNPFTLGHLHLVEYAASQCDFLHIFIVMEDKSQFPAADRIELVRQATTHLTHVFIHEGRDYIISSSTFPTYFLKKGSDIARIHATLDIDLFCRWIAPFFRIKKRFVGDEPSCEVTAVYNAEMERLLPANGIEFCKIPRITSSDGQTISASRVRDLLKQGQIEMVKQIVPKITYEYLMKTDIKDESRCLK